MPMPKIDAANAKKPLGYDASRKKYILFEEILTGKEVIIPIDSLSNEDFKKLVIERQLAGPDYRVQSISGTPMSRDDVVRAIRMGEPFGRMTLEAEKSYLRDLLTEIQRNMKV